MKSYHFSLGDSSEGPVGVCARVTADDAEDALVLLKDFLPEEHHISIPFESSDDQGARSGIEYINVYFNTAALTVKNIDDEDDLDEKEEGGSDADSE